MIPKENQLQTKKGFTLIELLVVIAIIALLLSILIPALNHIKKWALRKAYCPSNLKGWGTAITLYATANDDEIPETVGWENKDGTVNNRYPCEIYLEAKLSHKQFLSHELIRPYADGFNSMRLTAQEIIDLYNTGQRPDDLRLKEIWNCPSNRGETIESTMEWIKAGEEERNGRAFFRLQYAYFAGVNKWSNYGYKWPEPEYTTLQRDITGAQLSGKKLLMADIISYWGGWDGPCIYNHGEKGYSWDGSNSDYLHLCDYDGTPPITGINRLFGDGHVKWKDQFDQENMCLMYATEPQANPHVTGYDSDASFY